MSPGAAKVDATPPGDASESTMAAAGTATRRRSTRIAATLLPSRRRIDIASGQSFALRWVPVPGRSACAASPGAGGAWPFVQGPVRRPSSPAGAGSAIGEGPALHREEPPVVAVGSQVEPQDAPRVVVADLGRGQRGIAVRAQVPASGADDEQARPVR